MKFGQSNVTLWPSKQSGQKNQIRIADFKRTVKPMYRLLHTNRQKDTIDVSQLSLHTDEEDPNVIMPLKQGAFTIDSLSQGKPIFWRLSYKNQIHGSRVTDYNHPLTTV